MGEVRWGGGGGVGERSCDTCDENCLPEASRVRRVGIVSGDFNIRSLHLVGRVIIFELRTTHAPDGGGARRKSRRREYVTAVAVRRVASEWRSACCDGRAAGVCLSRKTSACVKEMRQCARVSAILTRPNLSTDSAQNCRKRTRRATE